jgi:hypothetical protein
VDIRDGATDRWRPARVEARVDRAWQRFEGTFTVSEPGTHQLTVRARDRSGAMQPADQHINQVATVSVTVAVS